MTLTELFGKYIVLDMADDDPRRIRLLRCGEELRIEYPNGETQVVAEQDIVQRLAGRAIISLNGKPWELLALKPAWSES